MCPEPALGSAAFRMPFPRCLLLRAGGSFSRLLGPLCCALLDLGLAWSGQGPGGGGPHGGEKALRGVAEGCEPLQEQGLSVLPPLLVSGQLVRQRVLPQPLGFCRRRAWVWSRRVCSPWGLSSVLRADPEAGWVLGGRATCFSPCPELAGGGSLRLSPLGCRGLPGDRGFLGRGEGTVWPERLGW